MLSMLKKLWGKYGPARKVVVIEGDTPPNRLPFRDIVLAKEDDEEWAVGFRCPCGCGKNLELMLVDEAKPNWSISIDAKQRPTLRPSVHLTTGCKSHFWVKTGKIIWCS
jgi:hypothetical protein